MHVSKHNSISCLLGPFHTPAVRSLSHNLNGLLAKRIFGQQAAFPVIIVRICIV